ncbi:MULTISPECIES: SDR family oxidoreductase [unclassified Paenibacillus]|uniref:SDR family oxidoreductase n=1 Tax=unclassified Paenibacillus TaxID=185978 RepID=UPI001AE4D316|nr:MULTISPECIES: SDR family oxidoreductase [unclassified Paenibacillus]MBP1157162.1 3-oxoacyl-[acyl-carrier protein] reductase [Paenibacillus sp. PvP091]MBP1172099.1 3-oxoacyl-[acyl-carrier protein] reductase [Paenibacillus sp. PvR098]MBP2438480.1 3-oxoacyl-[acyl-carrier protein] reductase [Paenibacillus sp. PvP052]
MPLHGKTALITASSSGIGKGIAAKLAQEGATIFLSGIEKDLLPQTADEIAESTGAKVHYLTSDFSNPDSIEELGRKAVEQMGSVDILVYNTGGPKPGAFLELTDKDWSFAYHLILDAAIRLTRIVLPQMQQNQWGRLVYMTSSSVVRPLPNLHLSNVMRAAVQALAESLSVEVGAHGITTHVVAPAHIDTARTRQLASYRAEQAGKSFEEVVREDLKGIPVGRYGKPEDIAALVGFLASDASSFMTGLTHLVDGGFTKIGPL